MTEKLFGIDGRRKIPSSSKMTFLNWWKAAQAHRQESRSDTPEGARIALFADTFTNFYDPKQGIAAVSFADKVDVQVRVPDRVCCGRPLISKGFLDKARVQAELTVRQLAPLAREGYPIVFCEPGCYSAVKDDHPHLLRGELKAMAQEVSAACLTFEEWAGGMLDAVEKERSNGRNRPQLQLGPERILLHAHCHQKALGGLPVATSLLRRIPGAEVIDADAGCCGMAGSFGYEKEHYNLSRAVGERKLFPAIRESGPHTTVVAPGFSCRQQIRHFTDATPLSAIELMDKLLG